MTTQKKLILHAEGSPYKIDMQVSIDLPEDMRKEAYIEYKMTMETSMFKAPKIIPENYERFIFGQVISSQVSGPFLIYPTKFEDIVITYCDKSNVEVLFKCKGVVNPTSTIPDELSSEDYKEITDTIHNIQYSKYFSMSCISGGSANSQIIDIMSSLLMAVCHINEGYNKRPEHDYKLKVDKDCHHSPIFSISETEKGTNKIVFDCYVKCIRGRTPVLVV